MSGEKDKKDSLSELWKRQKEEPMEITMESVMSDAQKFERDVRDRNILFGLLVGVGIFLVWLDYCKIEAHFLMRLGLAGIALSVIFFGIYMIKKGRNRKTTNSDTITSQFFETYRENLERQEKLMRNMAIWAVCSLTISYPLIVIGLILDSLAKGESMRLPIAFGIVAIVDIILSPIVILWLASTFRKKLEKIKKYTF